MKTPEDKCWVYWIRSSDMTDIFTEGYVGITCDIHTRISAHKKNAINQYYYQNPDFRKRLLSEDYVFQEILIGSRQYCLDIEYKLRPERYVGWNIAIGGEDSLRGSRLTHGLSKTKAGVVFYSLSWQWGIDHEEWKGRDGIKVFATWIDDLGIIPEDFTFYVIDKSKGISPENIGISDTRQGLWGKDLYSPKRKETKRLQEWAELLGIRHNTIMTRLCRDWSVDEALGLVPRRDVLAEHHANDVDKQLALYYLENTAMRHGQISELLGYNSTLKRLLHRFKIPKYLWEFCDVPHSTAMFSYRIPRQMNPNLHDFAVLSDIADQAEDWPPVAPLAEKYDVNHHTMKSLMESFYNAKIIRW